MIWSARPSTDGGIVRPSALAVLSPETPFTEANAVDINDRGEIVGRVGFRPVVWVPRHVHKRPRP